MPQKASLKYLGHVAFIRLPLGYEGDAKEVAEKILSTNPRVKTVLLVEGVEGLLRLPKVRFLAGSSDTVTVHREYGIAYKLDASKLMFSLGNSYERLRMRRLPKPKEIIVDMFAGVGQFTIPAAKSQAEKVYSFELNPEAYKYLLENIMINKVSEKVKAYLDDCRNAFKYGLEGIAYRVIMGYLKGTLNYLPTALRLAKPDGAYIHFHELAPSMDGWVELYNECKKVAEGMGYRLELMEKRKVKTYSRKYSHWVLDLWARFVDVP